jgi:hypothetical protein
MLAESGDLSTLTRLVVHKRLRAQGLLALFFSHRPIQKTGTEDQTGGSLGILTAHYLQDMVFCSFFKPERRADCHCGLTVGLGFSQ